MQPLSALLLAALLGAASACTPLYTTDFGPLAHHGRRLSAVSAILRAIGVGRPR